MNDKKFSNLYFLISLSNKSFLSNGKSGEKLFSYITVFFIFKLLNI